MVDSRSGGERRAEVHVSDRHLWGKEGGKKCQAAQFVQVGETTEEQKKKKKGMKRRRWGGGEGNRWRRDNRTSQRGKSKRQEGGHSHDGWALPVRRYVAVPRCPLGPVGWHSYWVSSNLGVLGRCQQGPCRKFTTTWMSSMNPSGEQQGRLGLSFSNKEFYVMSACWCDNRIVFLYMRVFLDTFLVLFFFCFSILAAIICCSS